ncbi:MAG: transposase [Candidatus Korobacteraceae bacterium]
MDPIPPTKSYGTHRVLRQTARSRALPGGALAKACNYTLTLWDKLTRFLEYPELELSNNLQARQS